MKNRKNQRGVGVIAILATIVIAASGGAVITANVQKVEDKVEHFTSGNPHLDGAPGAVVGGRHKPN